MSLNFGSYFSVGYQICPSKPQLDLRCLCNGKCCSNCALFLRAQLRSNMCNCALQDTVAISGKSERDTEITSYSFLLNF